MNFPGAGGGGMMVGAPSILVITDPHSLTTGRVVTAVDAAANLVMGD